MALAVPLSRFASQVGGGSAFYVRPTHHKIMMTIELKIKPNPRDADVISGMMNAAVVAALSQIKQIEDAVADIRDPQTGEGAKVTWSSHVEGIKVSISGSDFVRAEAEKRVAALPK